MNLRKLMIIIFLLLIIGVTFLLTGCINDNENNNTNSKSQIFKNITVFEAYDLIQNNTNNPDFIILDIRTSDEYDSGHINNSIMIDFYSSSFRDELDELDKNKVYLIYCRTARRTGLTFDIMNELGFYEVYNMLGGITQWQAEGFPIEKN